jgi:hypothetical protein
LYVTEESDIWNLKPSIMTKEEFFKSKYFKILLPVLVVALIITLWRDGYEFGQWLYQNLHGK